MTTHSQEPLKKSETGVSKTLAGRARALFLKWLMEESRGARAARGEYDWMAPTRPASPQGTPVGF